MGRSHIPLSRRQQPHAAGSFLSARWLIGQDQSPLGVATEWDVDCPPDVAHSSWASSFHLPSLTPPSPPPPSQQSTLPPPDSHTHPPYTTHTHTYTHTRAPLCEAKLCSIPVPWATSRTVDQTPPQREGGGRRLYGVGEYCLVTLRGRLCEMK